MDKLIPQRVVTVSINGTDENATVTYTFVSPVTGQSYVNAPNCDMVSDQPTYTLFVLDFPSTQNGWTITGITRRTAANEFMYTAGPLNLSILLLNSWTFNGTYDFYINYFNMPTQSKLPVDPQEGNIPRG